MTLPVAAPWFREREIAEGLRQIDEPHADEFVRGNIWCRRGRDSDLIVDTGLGVASLKAFLKSGAETESGAAAESRAAAESHEWREPIVVLTHGHLDHAGGAGGFADVRAHPADIPAEIATLDGAKFASGIGLDPELGSLPPLLVTAAPSADWTATSLVAPVINPRPLRDGDIIDLGDRQYEVLEAPGHTPGSIVLFDARNGELFSGDVVYDDILLDTLKGSDAAAYANSLRRLLELPVVTVRPGHGDSFDQATLHRVIRRYLQPSRRDRDRGRPER